VITESEEVTAIVHPEERAMENEEAMEIEITEQELGAESAEVITGSTEVTAIVHPEERAMVKEEAMETVIKEQEQGAESAEVITASAEVTAIVRPEERAVVKEEVMETDLQEEMETIRIKNTPMVSALREVLLAIDLKKKSTNQKKDNTKSLSQNLK
jgi:hypothetical protein